MTEEGDETPKNEKSDLRSMFRSLVNPVIEQVEHRVSTQIDDEVAEKVDELLSTRMVTVDRAIGDLDRHVAELTARLDRLERQLGQMAAANDADSVTDSDRDAESD